MLKNCTKCSIYNLEENFICDAQVTGFTKTEAHLILLDDFADQLATEVLVTFYDDVLGLVSYSCSLSNYKEVILTGFRNHYSVSCQANNLIEIIQRRNDIKVKTSIDTILSAKDSEQNEFNINVIVKNISAGGLFFISKDPILLTQEFTFVFQKGAVPLTLNARVIRIQEVPQEGYVGYGCEFVRLTVAKESLIREFVFREQVRHKHEVRM